MHASALSSILDSVFAQLVGAPSVEEDVIAAIAQMALRHPAASAIARQGEYMGRMAEVWGATFPGFTRFRYNGFIADEVMARVGRADCCGQAGKVHTLCSFCTIVWCERCARNPPGLPSEMARACAAGVLSPECACMYDGSGGMVRRARGASFMLDEGSGRLRPVWFSWP